MQDIQCTAWRNFSGSDWKSEINVRDFIVSNVTPFARGSEFLAKPSERTLAVWNKLRSLFREDIKMSTYRSRPISRPATC